MENDIRKGTVKVRDFSMDYLRAGSGKEPLVILPGMSVKSVMCFADAVADAYKVLFDDFAPDYKERLLKFFRD